ncbi:MAG: TonB-dependent receptor [Candidatus Solibacter usitatus]|nr:TonB-dependent receptor [Candidatus Solibacter usitatus]
MLSLLALCARPLEAQALGAITGVVRDVSGAVIPGAAVRVAHQQTGAGETVLTQGNGVYLAPQLAPGEYRVAVTAAGFKTLEITGLKVDVDTTLTQDVLLELGQVSETIKVEGHTNLVETASGQVGTTVQVSHVLEMPLADRNVFTLVNLVPGAFFRGGEVSLGGGRTRSAQALLDGVVNSRGGVAAQQIELTPPVDSMQEFKVEINNLGAEYGRSSAGVVNAVTRSGGNRYSGSLYEFLRNDKLDAAGWNNDRKPPLRRNNFGGTMGGPIVRNRTFFFYNYDALREGVGQSLTRNVGLPEWRRGDFSTATRDAGNQAAPVVIYDPETGTGTFGNPRSTLPFPNNIIPASRLDLVARKAAAYLPAPNRPADNPFNRAGNWQENRVNTLTRDYHTARLDHEWTPGTRMFFRYIVTQPERERNAYSRGYGVADPEGTAIDNRRQNAALNLTHLFSPFFFLNLTAGVNRVFIRRRTGDCCDTNYGTLLGIPNVPGEVFPRFNFGGGLAPVTEMGASGNANRRAAITNTDLTARFSKVAGAHTFKFGVQHSRFNGNELSRNQPSGVYGFNGRLTQGFTAGGSTISNSGLPFADFLLGRINSADATVSPSYGRRLQYYAGYFQDDWRLSPNLTFNLGIRYETETPVYEVAGRMNSFDPWAPNPLAGTGDIPPNATGIVLFPNRNGQGKYLWRWDKNNFSPRIGFAWRVLGTSTTVVRGGFGLFYGNPYDRETVQQLKAGFGNVYRARSPVPFRLRDGLPKEAFEDIPPTELLPTFGNRGTRYETSQIQFLDPNRVTPYTENFNLTVQHQWRGILFDLGYLGNLGRHIAYPNININHIPPDLLPRTEIPERLRRPVTVFGSDQAQVQILAPNWGLSNYHAFTLKTERRFRDGHGWVLSYTFSKWIDNVQFTGGDDVTFGDDDQPQNIYNLRGERSLSTNHVPHRLVVSPIVELPFGKGKRWLNRGGAWNAVAGGWQLSALATARSGAPFGVLVLNGPRDILGDQADGKNLRPDLVANASIGELRGRPAERIRGLQWFDPNAFRVPPRFTHGNVSRTVPGILGPGSLNFDSLVAKNFTARERWRAQFRWETFNTLNTPEFDLPNQTLGGGGFGLVTGAGRRRIMQFGLKLYW